MQELGISFSIIVKMGRGEQISLTVLERICEYLDCDIGDIVKIKRIEGKK